ncbi:MAG: asparagine synthase-related protein [Candidatus Acidiferrales bacterium]
MVETLLHENFYVSGIWTDEVLGVYVGWIARKDSFSDGMPLKNEHGDTVLVFSGEEFPESGIVQRLRANGHEMEEEGPSYLVHLAEEGSSFPANLNGRFHGLLLDRRNGTSTLFNDRYGVHRLYYHQSKDAFYFAAEAKAILAVCPELRRLDQRGLGEFIACGSVLENRTLFEGVYVLPPASAWSFRNGELQDKRRYFDPQEWEQQGTLDSEDYYAQIRDVFARNLPRYFTGKQRVGMSLTGGLDTRMILAWQKCQAGTLPCYTFGSEIRENHDVRVARRVAAACRQPFQVIPAGSDFLARFPHYAERAVYLTDGCVDVSRAPDLYLNERAREIAPVRMTGNYGSEILRGVRAFKPEAPRDGLFAPEVLSHARRAGQTFSEISKGHPVHFAAFKQIPWHLYGILALEQTQLSMRSPFLDNDFVRTVFCSPAAALSSNGVSLRLVKDGNPELFRIATDRGLGGNRGRVFGAAGRGFREFQFKAEYAYDMGMPQWLAQLDHTFSGLRLERLFLGRHKVFHFRTWYRGVLASYLRENLLNPRGLSRPYLEKRGLEEVVEGHLAGNRNYTNEIHKLLTLEILHRALLDRAPGRRDFDSRLSVSVAAAY